MSSTQPRLLLQLQGARLLRADAHPARPPLQRTHECKGRWHVIAADRPAAQLVLRNDCTVHAAAHWPGADSERRDRYAKDAIPSSIRPRNSKATATANSDAHASCCITDGEARGSEGTGVRLREGDVLRVSARGGARDGQGRPEHKMSFASWHHEIQGAVATMPLFGCCKGSGERLERMGQIARNGR